MSTGSQDYMAVALRALRQGRLVTLDNCRAYPARVGAYSMIVARMNGTRLLSTSVNREEARQLVAEGADFVGPALRAP